MPPGERLLEYVNYTCSVQLRCEFVATSPLAATLVQEVPADSGKLPWYMTDSTALQLQ